MTDENLLIPHQTVKIRELSSMTGLSISTIRSLIKQKKFPEPLRLAPKVHCWKVDEIHEWWEGLENERKN